MHTGGKIVLTLCGLLAMGLVMRATLPHISGLVVMRKGQTFLLPFNRIAFWVCVIAGVVASGVVMIRAMLRDLGLR
ncbi:MAG: hypothetical protein ACRD2O_14190 [Terriglobia bacterium]